MKKAFTATAFERRIKDLSDEHHGELVEIIKRVAECYGHPHKHLGLGIRKLPGYLECRDSLDNRLVFEEEGDALVFVYYGTHDEVKRMLRNA